MRALFRLTANGKLNVAERITGEYPLNIPRSWCERKTHQFAPHPLWLIQNVTSWPLFIFII